MKAITIPLGALAIAAVLAGCNGGTDTAEETTTPAATSLESSAAASQPVIPVTTPAAQPVRKPYAWVALQTSYGDIVLRLDRERAPISVANFLAYTNEGFYDGTIFHRVLRNFVIQGGGFTPGMTKKPTKDSIANEWRNGLKNLRGTISMARTRLPDSATSQFFLSVQDNPSLDQPREATGGAAYAVFGEIVAGMNVVDRIRQVPTGQKGSFGGVPLEDVVLVTASQLTPDEARERIVIVETDQG